MMTAGNRLGLPTNVSYCISHTLFEKTEILIAKLKKLQFEIFGRKIRQNEGLESM